MAPQKCADRTGGVEAFVFDSELLRVVVFEQAQRGAAKQAEVGGGVTFAQVGLIFLERHIELPMPFVLDRPVAANGLSEAACGEFAAEDIVTRFDGLFPVACRLV